jgi:ElaB/YqjD/DUF883 family membrane-anchored ribosome-binding protein
MDTQHAENKIKANGKWAASEARDVGKEISTRSQDVLETIQDGVAELLKMGQKYAKSGSDQALDLAKKYPVQAVCGGLVIGLFLGAKIFGGRRA